jgi:hypothetical protein
VEVWERLSYQFSGSQQDSGFRLQSAIQGHCHKSVAFSLRKLGGPNPYPGGWATSGFVDCTFDFWLEIIFEVNPSELSRVNSKRLTRCSGTSSPIEVDWSAPYLGRHMSGDNQEIMSSLKPLRYHGPRVLPNLSTLFTLPTYTTRPNTKILKMIQSYLSSSYGAKILLTA